jgi:hypothetical protein
VGKTKGTVKDESVLVQALERPTVLRTREGGRKGWMEGGREGGREGE